MDSLQKIRTAVSSKRFFIGIIILVLLQCSWYIASVRPKMFDEPRHITFITKYTERLNPFISQQTSEWDSLGEVTRDPNYLFYYLMSFPARLARFFNDSYISQVLALRIIALSIFILGLIFWRRLFKAWGLSAAVSNIALLFLVLIPTIAPLPAAVNYDGATFAFTGLILLWVADLLQSRKLDVLKLARVVIVGLLVCLIKFTFIAIIVPVLLLVSFYLIRDHGKKLWPEIRKSFLSLSILLRLSIVVGLLISVGLFVERPVVNLVKHRNIAPACQNFIGEKRCAIDLVAARNHRLLKEKPADFTPLSPPDYALLLWVPSMITTQARVTSATSPTLPMQFLFYGLFLAGVLAVAYYLGSIKKKSRVTILLIAVSLFYGTILFLENYQAYVKYATPLAMNGRYLLPVMPVFLALVALAFRDVVGSRYRNMMTVGFVFMILVFSQGGGITTGILTVDNSYYWENSRVIHINGRIKKVVSALIFERNPYKKF